MTDAIDRLMALRVRDVMAQNVVVVRARQRMDEAARLFAEHDVSSAPVVDEQGRCVGMLSAADFVKNATRNGSASGDVQATIPRMPLGHISESMTSAVQSVASSTSLVAAARMMCEQHIHRMPVIDEHHRPIGVISTMDVTAAVVNSMDEMKSIAVH